MTNAPQPGGSGRRHVWTRGDRLRAAREDQPGRPSQAEFAALLGFGTNTVARYERDEKGATKPIVVIRWSQVTGYDYEWLMDGDSDGGGIRDTAPATSGYRAAIRLPGAMPWAA